jgi:hypothetical protein
MHPRAWTSKAAGVFGHGEAMTANPGLGASDFLARLVSRSAGKDLAIEPRLPSVFESTNVEPVVPEFSQHRSEAADGTAEAPEPAPGGSTQIRAGTRIEKRTENGWLAADPAPTGILGAQMGIDETRDPPALVPPEALSGVHSRKAQPNEDDPLEALLVQQTRPQHAPPKFVPNESRSPVQLHRPGHAVSGVSIAQAHTGILVADDSESFQPFTEAQRSRAAAMGETARENSASPAIDAAPQRITDRKSAPQWVEIEDTAQHARAGTAAESQTPEHRFDRTEQFAQFAAPPSAARWRPVPALAETRVQPAAEPVINITIGRVEVRAAVSGGQPAPQPKRGAPPLSLDSYLQNRARGT